MNMKVKPSEFQKFLSPALLEGTKDEKKIVYAFGKAISNIGKMVATKFIRLYHLFTKGEWVNNNKVMKQLDKNITDLTDQLKKNKENIGFDRGVIHTYAQEMLATCKLLKKSGANPKDLEKLQGDLQKLDNETIQDASEIARKQKPATQPERGKIADLHKKPAARQMEEPKESVYGQTDEFEADHREALKDAQARKAAPAATHAPAKPAAPAAAKPAEPAAPPAAQPVAQPLGRSMRSKTHVVKPQEQPAPAAKSPEETAQAASDRASQKADQLKARGEAPAAEQPSIYRKSRGKFAHEAAPAAAQPGVAKKAKLKGPQVGDKTAIQREFMGDIFIQKRIEEQEDFRYKEKGKIHPKQDFKEKMSEKFQKDSHRIPGKKQIMEEPLQNVPQGAAKSRDQAYQGVDLGKRTLKDHVREGRERPSIEDQVSHEVADTQEEAQIGKHRFATEADRTSKDFDRLLSGEGGAKKATGFMIRTFRDRVANKYQQFSNPELKKLLDELANPRFNYEEYNNDGIYRTLERLESVVSKLETNYESFVNKKANSGKDVMYEETEFGREVLPELREQVKEIRTNIKREEDQLAAKSKKRQEKTQKAESAKESAIREAQKGRGKFKTVKESYVEPLPEPDLENVPTVAPIMDAEVRKLLKPEVIREPIVKTGKVPGGLGSKAGVQDFASLRIPAKASFQSVLNSLHSAGFIADSMKEFFDRRLVDNLDVQNESEKLLEEILQFSKTSTPERHEILRDFMKEIGSNRDLIQLNLRNVILGTIQTPELEKILKKGVFSNYISKLEQAAKKLDEEVLTREDLSKIFEETNEIISEVLKNKDVKKTLEDVKKGKTRSTHKGDDLFDRLAGLQKQMTEIHSEIIQIPKIKL